MRGTLSLSSPWCRQEFPVYAERRAIADRIPEGYTVSVMCRGDHSAFGVTVMEWAASGNREVRERRYYRDVRVGIEEALDWIDAHDLAMYAGVAVAVR